MDRNQTIAKKLSEFRKENKFTQSSIANFLGVDQSLVSKVELGERSLSADMLEKLACLYGITLADFESEKTPSLQLSLAFRASNLSEHDMQTISDIQRIALNINFMDSLTSR